MTTQSAADIASVLKKSGFFGTVSEEVLGRVSRMSRFEKYGKDEVVFADSAPCTGMYIVASGAIKIYKIGPDGREHVVHLAEPGDSFGEAALFLDSMSFPAYAGAVKPSSVVFIPKKPMLELLGSDHSLCLQVLGSLASWTHKLVNKLETLALKDAGSRFASYLLSKADAATGKVDLRTPKRTLAAHLAVSSETLSRLLNRFEAQGLIVSSGRSIRITDLKGLIKISEAEN